VAFFERIKIDSQRRRQFEEDRPRTALGYNPKADGFKITEPSMVLVQHGSEFRRFDRTRVVAPNQLGRRGISHLTSAL
jgi:hypothetical protein